MRWTLAQTFNTILVSSIVTSVAGAPISIKDDSADLERREPARQKARPPPLKLTPRPARAARLTARPSPAKTTQRRPSSPAQRVRSAVWSPTVLSSVQSAKSPFRSPSARTQGKRQRAPFPVRSPALQRRRSALRAGVFPSRAGISAKASAVRRRVNAPVPRRAVSPSRARKPLAAAARLGATSPASRRVRTLLTASSARHGGSSPIRRPSSPIRTVKDVDQRNAARRTAALLGRVPKTGSASAPRLGASITRHGRTNIATRLGATSLRRTLPPGPQVGPQGRKSSVRSQVSSRAQASLRTLARGAIPKSALARSIPSSRSKGGLISTVPGTRSRSASTSSPRGITSLRSVARVAGLSAKAKSAGTQRAKGAVLCRRAENGATSCTLGGDASGPSAPSVAGPSTPATAPAVSAVRPGAGLDRPINGGSFKESRKTEKLYADLAKQRGQVWDHNKHDFVTLPQVLDPNQYNVDHLAEGQVFAEAVKQAGYTNWNQLPKEAYDMVHGQVNHIDNVLYVHKKQINAPKGVAYQDVAAGKEAKVLPVVKTFIDKTRDGVHPHLEKTDTKWEELRRTHADWEIKEVGFLEKEKEMTGKIGIKIPAYLAAQIKAKEEKERKAAEAAAATQQAEASGST